MPTLEDASNAITRGNLQQARLIYEALLQENPRNEEAWLGLAEVLPETNDKRICYENVLRINKQNRVARDGLRNLEPQADPLVDALKQRTASESNVYVADTPVIAEGPVDDVVPAARRETPTAVLVALGLALSVVAFAIVGGAVYLLLSSLAGG